MAIHVATSYPGFWQFLVHQFVALGHQPHGCVLGLLGNHHGATRWIWLQRWSGRTAPCFQLNHGPVVYANPDW